MGVTPSDLGHISPKSETFSGGLFGGGEMGILVLQIHSCWAPYLNKSMIKDIILSFKENIKDKTTNPFLGTFAIVAIVRNWDFIITVINLDLFYTLEKKKEALSPYFQVDTFLWGILTNTWVTVVAIALTYGLLNLSRLIVNFFDKVVTPIVYQLTDKGSVVLKADFNKLKGDKEKLEQRLEKERESRLKVQAERDNLETRIIELISKANNTEQKESKDETPKKAVEPKETNVIDSIYSMVHSRNLLEKFKYAVDVIEAQSLLNANDESVKYFARLGLLKKKSEYGTGSEYTFTELGRQFRQFLLRKGEL